jgi:PAS domain S-box-containing protein
MTRQEEQFRLALELTQTGVWDWDLITGSIDWNDSHYTLLGYQPREVESTYQAWRDRVHPDDLVATEQKLLQAQEKQSDYEAEFRVIYPDGVIH